MAPYLTAVSQLYGLTSRMTDALPAATFFSAVNGFYDALDPALIPGFPEVERDRVRDLIVQIQRLSAPETVSMICAQSFVRDMRKLGLIPSRDQQENEETARELLRQFLESSEPSPENAAARAAGGGIRLHSRTQHHRRTIRGDFVDDLVIGALQMDGVFHIGHPSQVPDLSPAVDELRKTRRFSDVQTGRRTLPEAHDAEFEPAPLPPAPVIAVEGPPPSSSPEPEEDKVAALRAAFEDERGRLLREAESARQSAVEEAHARVWQSITEGDFPLTEPNGGLLLVKGGLYLAYAQEMYDVVVGSQYKLMKRIGEGGSSLVYVAEEIGTERKVAVKILKEGQEDRERIHEAHRNELRLQPILKTDHFVHAYTHGLTAGDSPYIVMELMEGGSLADFIGEMTLGRRKPALRELTGMLLQAVASVAEAQKRGVLHRDIKPENFFISSEGKVKLGDFGIAQKTSDMVPRPSENIFGTPGYIPPEISRPQGPTSIDTPQNDVWALGVTLYELLTGVFPFEAATSTGIMINSLSKEPPPPSQVRPDLGIPPALDRIIAKAMAKNPKDRHQDASDLLYELLVYEADALEEEAYAILRRSMTTNADLNIYQDEWREKIQDALRVLRAVYDRYPHPKIIEKRIRLNFDLFRWADRRGDVELARRTVESINALAPGSEIANQVNRPVQVNFYPDGLERRKDRIRVEIVKYAYRAGFIDFEQYFSKPKDEFPFGALRFPRGAVVGAKFSGPGLIPVYIPLPVRAGSYQIRVPVYRVGQVPRGWMILPAGPVAARQMPGSFAEQFDNWREVTDDYGVGPFVTEADWALHLQAFARTHGTEAARRRIPRNWEVDKDLTSFRYTNGQPIIEMAPVTYILHEHAREYLDQLTLALKTDESAWSDITFPPMNVWKRFLRGNDARMWPWGDALPAPGIAGFRFPDPRFARSLTALPINEKNIRDISPFSVPSTPGDAESITISHVAGNVQHILELSDPKERELIAGVFQMTTETLAKHFIVAGSSYRSSAPTNPDILEPFPLDSVGPWGIRPVVRLRHAAATPSIVSLSSNS
ncbi:MAG TPA: serine/threonine-protein kinase [bacterium]|nr:serine/threonine-protein kinase [bacterium]